MSLISILLLTLHLTLSTQAKHTNEHALKQAVSALASASIQNPSYLNKDKRDLFNSASSETSTHKCQKITVPMCQHMEYNLTSMPNQFNHETQQEAAMEAHQFWALVEINCSKDLRFFLCSMYTPVCVPNYPKPIRACKSVCIRARIGCERYMKKFDFDWPEHMNCDLFPEYGSGKEVCMDPMDASSERKSTQLNINHNINNADKPKSKSSPKRLEVVERKVNLIEIASADELLDQEAASKPDSAYLLDKLCTYPFIRLAPSPFDARYNKISTGGLANCIQPCQSSFFSQSEQMFAYYWLLMWSMLCLASCLITGLTYLIQSSRFRYPEKPIIYLSMCYLFVSAGYLVRFGAGHEQSSCEPDGSIKYSTSRLNNSSSLSASQSSSSVACTLTFILVYYFGMASSAWWVIISFTWFLAAGLKWSTEAIAKYKFYFHMLAWLLPFVKTVAILTLSHIDAEPLSGMCYVGNLSTRNLRIFVLAPSLVYLLVGVTFLASGFISLFRIRKLIKRQHGDWAKAHKLEKLMIRIGIFSILYTVPATCVIACQFYEQMYRAEWERSALCKKHAKLNGLSDNLVYKFCARSSESPEFSVFVLKYLMSLIVGVTSGFWIWTNKTVKSWKQFFSRVFSCSATHGASSNKLDSTSSPSSANTTQDAVSCFGCCFSRKAEKKDSIVFFQANGDLEHNPHNYYEGKLVQPQLLINPIQDDMNIYEKKQFMRQVSASSPINNYQAQQFTLKSAGGIYHQPHDQISSAVEYKNGSASTQPLYVANNSNQVIQCQQAQSNGFFYDYSSTASSSRNDRTNTTSSKYSSASRK
jgi:frizzled protein 5/8